MHIHNYNMKNISDLLLNALFDKIYGIHVNYK
jgi:hypothetical protein